MPAWRHFSLSPTITWAVMAIIAVKRPSELCYSVEADVCALSSNEPTNRAPSASVASCTAPATFGSQSAPPLTCKRSEGLREFEVAKPGVYGMSSDGKRWDPRLGSGAPEGAFRCQCLFTPARGVIHHSFPLRGRWERSVKSDEQAPSPSLAPLHISSFETRPRYLLMHDARQWWFLTLFVPIR
jgi:hypothetical protein